MGLEWAHKGGDEMKKTSWDVWIVVVTLKDGKQTYERLLCPSREYARDRAAGLRAQFKGATAKRARLEVKE